MDKLLKFFDEMREALSNGSSDLLTSTIILSLGVSVLLSLYIFFVYRLSNKSGFYSKNFNKTLAIMGITTSAIVLSMQTNVFVSLGMVGALSIVRFRNVVKDPYDLLFLFWSISSGIICGTGLYFVAFILAVVVTFTLLLLERVSMPRSPALLVVNSTDSDTESALLPLVKEYSKNYRIKSRNLHLGGIDLIVEVRAQNEAELVKACGKLDGVTCVSLLSHDGELRV